MFEQGWEPREDFGGATGDTLYGLDKIYALYLKMDNRYSGRATMPVLWGEQRETIASNESVDTIRMLNRAFDDRGSRPGNYYPGLLFAPCQSAGKNSLLRCTGCAFCAFTIRTSPDCAE